MPRTRKPNSAPRRLRSARGGSITLIFAASMTVLLLGVGIAINIAQVAAGRAALQRAVDTAALSGAASYVLDSAAFNALGIQTATSAFCDTVANLPTGAAVVAQSGGQTCNATPGPVVTAVTDSYITGTPGITHAAGVSCTGTYLPAAPYNCGFIVTVSAKITVQSALPKLFGQSTVVSATGMAVNPFISFAKIFSLPAGVVSGAKYANSVWAYPLLLNASGAPDYTTNGGAVPDTSACVNDSPDTTTCGKIVMLASTIYAGSGTGYTAPASGVIYDSGVVRNPPSPTAITATQPIGIAFRSIAGGNFIQYTPPGVYGYTVNNLGASPPTYTRALLNNCIYPNHNLAYNTFTQVWTTTPWNVNGALVSSYSPVLPWGQVTHWFFSSYLVNNLPPSQPEIAAQTLNNENIQSVTNDSAQAGANVQGKSTYNAAPFPAVPASCPSTTLGISNNLLATTTYLIAGLDNCSLYITQSTTAGASTPNPAYTGSCFDPAATPGQAYAAMNCQTFGSYYYTFFWNDMGGALYDNANYGDGTVQLSCAAAAHVALIN